MGTKEQALSSAKFSANRNKQDRYIYRVGSAWMFTSQSEEETQKHYKVKIKEFQTVSWVDVEGIATSFRSYGWYA